MLGYRFKAAVFTGFVSVAFTFVHGTYRKVELDLLFKFFKHLSADGNAPAVQLPFAPFKGRTA